MPDYRRWRLPGGSYFFTVNLANRRSNLLVERVEQLRRVVRRVRQKHPFALDAVVILPEHLHMIWTLPPGDSDFSIRWALIKAGFSRAIPKGDPRHPEVRSASRVRSGERGIWQRRFYEHLLRDDDDFAAHVDYIHYNPVKHGHAKRPADWPYSSIHRYIRQGIVPKDWGCLTPPPDLGLG